jgi:molybdenum cofactor biosynthesis protein B
VGRVTTPEGTRAHREEAERITSLRLGVLTVSDSRTKENDESGAILRDRMTLAGHTVVVQELLPNDEERVRAVVTDWTARDDLDAVLITGGTGLGSRDRTIEAVRPLFDKELPGFGEIFRVLSYQEQVGAAAMLSRATAGSVRGRIVVSLPGSRAAVTLAVEKLLVPELAHAVREVRR